ncbi:MAG: hypothetical protein RLY31_1059 [Bacteroidota bacterium]|jgi:aminopeptidase N
MPEGNHALRTVATLALLLALAPAAAGQGDWNDPALFDRADTLRGMLRPERTCYDVIFYALDLSVDIEGQRIEGSVDLHFRTTDTTSRLQVDLYRNMDILDIRMAGTKLSFLREHDAVFIGLPGKLPAGLESSLQIRYAGKPQVARNAPWDGGFVWKTDPQGHPWVGVACEGAGASLWWPCKDHLSDEPDSLSVQVTVPNDLTAVSNGNLRSVTELPDGSRRFHWFVSYPINNYNVSVSIARYAHFQDTWQDADGNPLPLDYYVLPHNLEKAKKHFEQVKPMLSCYERYFGPYPFPRDGFALVETPYLGMEHQSGIAYGNRYNRGYLGGMIPSDMDWDFIIIHESGHEWFGNAVSVRDHADMWIHESFTTYLEALYVECRYGYQDAIRYLEGQKPFIKNIEPIVGPPNVNFDRWASSDHYYKGAWILHTLRHTIGQDSLFFPLLRGFYDRYKYQTCETADFIVFAENFLDRDLSGFFGQYLHHAEPPTLEYALRSEGKDLVVRYRWLAATESFDMPVRAGREQDYQVLLPTTGRFRETVFPRMAADDFRIATELAYFRTREIAP